MTTTVEAVRTRLVAGAAPGRTDDLPDRLRRALHVAGEVGAPALPALDAAAAAEADVRDRERAVAVATAQSKAVAGGLGVMPLVVVPLLSRVVGGDLLSFYGTPAGAAVGAVALTLHAIGLLAIWRIVRRTATPARRPPAGAVAVGVGLPVALVVHPVAGLAAGAGTWWWRRRRRTGPAGAGPHADEVADLVATALTGGATPASALRLAAGALPAVAPGLHRCALALELGRRPAYDDATAAVVDVLLETARWGAPSAPPLRRLASDLRADERARALAAAERLPVLMTFPTALCLLPASVLLVGAPLLAHGLAGAQLAW